MTLTEEDVQKILRIVDEMGYGEVRLEYGDLKLQVRKSPIGERGGPETNDVDDSPVVPSLPAVARAVAQASVTADDFAGSHLVKAPFAAIFYRSPSPGAAPFVQPGQAVTADETVCLIEVMKLFQSVSAGAAGRVIRVLVEDGQQVAEGQPLFVVEPG